MEAVTKLTGAKWIGLPDEEIVISDNQKVYFRTQFVLNKPGLMKIAISAHNRYKLWVNGHRAGAGPCKGDRWRWYYEVVDISSFLKQGINVIAVEVVHFPPAAYKGKSLGGPWSVVSVLKGPWLAAKGICEDENGKVLADITTGSAEWFYRTDESITWESSEKPEFKPIGAFENVNGSCIPWGWMTDEILPEEWKEPVKKWDADGCAWGGIPVLPMEERKIPFMYFKNRQFVREMDIRPDDLKAITFKDKEQVELEPGSGYVIELDAGELTTGYPIIRTRKGLGSKLTIRYAESYSLPPVVQYQVKGVRDDCENFRLLGYEDSYRPSSGDDVYETFWFRTFRFIRIEAEAGPEPLVLMKPEYVETGYPLEVKSEIHSEEHWVGRLWDISIRTLKRCMHETYEDCPYYEQLQYLLDTRLQALFTYAVSGDTRLALKAIEDFHSSLTPEGLLFSAAPFNQPHIIPTFSLYWILMLEDYYLETGDLEIVKRYRPAMDAILDWFDRKLGGYGLCEKYVYWEFVDWVEEWQNEINQITGTPKASHYGPSATNNLVYAYALRSAARLLKAAGRPDTALEYKRRADEINSNIEKYCWSEEKGMYREGPEVEEYTQHAQAMAVLSGLAEGEKAVEILKNCLTDGKAHICTYVFSFFLFRALEKAGLYHMTDILLDKWRSLLNLNLTTLPEDLRRQRSDCHGWSALSLYEFTRCILGVQPEEPGWGKIKIEPHTLSLPNAKGRVITAKGIVEVEWKKTQYGLKLRGNVPKGLYTRIVLQGKTVKELPQGGDFMVEDN